MKKLCLWAMLLVMLSGAVGCHAHEWQPATCTEPNICVSCGETDGEPLGHKWNEATCIAPKTCSVCAAAEGEPAEHTWVEATCQAPKFCSVEGCDAVEGEALPHSFGNWYMKDELGRRKCELCETEEILEYTVDCTVEEFISSTTNILQFMGQDGMSLVFNEAENIYDVLSDQTKIGSIVFVQDGAQAVGSDQWQQFSIWWNEPMNESALSYMDNQQVAMAVLMQFSKTFPMGINEASTEILDLTNGAKRDLGDAMSAGMDAAAGGVEYETFKEACMARMVFGSEQGDYIYMMLQFVKK